MAVGMGSAVRFAPIVLEPGAPGAFGCFGTWENVRACQGLGSQDDPLQGCSQSHECRHYTLARNPPTMRFRAKPRRDGRFEVQQFREFIGDQETYRLDVHDGRIEVTYPGDRKVPKSRRFFLHTKHVRQAGMDLERDFELIITLERMLVRQAGEGSAVVDAPRPTRPVDEDPDARRKRISERLRKKVSQEALGKDEDDDLDIELDGDLDIDIDVDLDDDDDDDDDLDSSSDSSADGADGESDGAAEDGDEDGDENVDESVDENVDEDQDEALPEGVVLDDDEADEADDDDDADADADEPPPAPAVKKAAAKKAATKKAATKKTAAKKTAAKKSVSAKTV